MSDLRLISVQTYEVDRKPSHQYYRPDDSRDTRDYYETPLTGREQLTGQYLTRQQPSSQSRPYSMKTSKPASHNRQYDKCYYRQDLGPAPPSRSLYDQTSSRISEVSAHGATPGDGAQLYSLTESSVKKLGPSTGGEPWRLSSWAVHSRASVYSEEFLEKMRRVGRS